VSDGLFDWHHFGGVSSGNLQDLFERKGSGEIKK
jgi:hypothetical protein